MVNIYINKRCVVVQFPFFLLYEAVNSKEMMHLHIIVCDMIVFDIDIVSSAFLDTPI